ncbi:hypothetical protein LBBP_02177 [Leptospira borgpetersenii serovar Ballum]|uniref:Uncharacterized protein n=1 Tax=Leptospira borgpetersenii serovar Ballum TaxID=280505 RepID=A0A0S2ISG3_LEPBO|nr:hypothetical protein LBBP_02177 [Leptospira borgpetersenii serovar Ballum]
MINTRAKIKTNIRNSFVCNRIFCPAVIYEEIYFTIQEIFVP